MNVDRPALMALLLFGLLGLGFAVVGLHIYRPAAPTDTNAPQKKKDSNGPELLPLPRTVESVSRMLHISVSSPGFAVEGLEQTAAKPLEHFLRGLDGVVSVWTRIYPGQVRLTVALANDRDLQQARAEVINRLNGAQAFLPPSASPPVLESRDPDALPIVWIAIRENGTRTPAQLSDVMRGEVRNALLQIPGISDVELRTEVRRQLRVQIDPLKLQARALAITDVVEAIGKNHVSMNVENIDELEKTVISARNGVPVFLRDVGVVGDVAEPIGFAAIDGERSILAGVHAGSSVNAAQLAGAIRGSVDEINKRLPPDIKVEIVADSTRAAAEDLLLEIGVPDGTARETSEETVRKLEQTLRQRLPRDKIGTLLTLGPARHGDTHRIHLLLTAAEERALTSPEIHKQIRKVATEFPALRLRLLQLPSGSLGRSAEFPIRLRISGPDHAQLCKWSGDVVRRAADADSGLIDAAASSVATTTDLRVVTDREKAARLGVTVRDVLEAIDAAQGNAFVNSKGTVVSISLGEQTKKVDELGQIPIRGADGKPVPLRNIAKLERTESAAMLERFNGQRCVTITANPQPGNSVANAQASLRKIAEEARNKLKLPDAFKIVEPSGP